VKRLENLPEITDEMLGGLHASQSLKEEILRDGRRALQGEKVKRSTPWAQGKARRSARAQFLRTAGALACLAVFAAGVLIGIPGLLTKPANPLIDTQIGGGLPAGGQSSALDMPRGSIVISQRDKPAYRGVWEPASGANFPLVCVDGRYYRMMSNPTALGSDLMGGALGAVDTFTSEPALVEGGIISNVVSQGETVYAVRGMDGAAVAATVNGSLRVFQRVSFGSSALKGGESLASTLGTSPVTALELTGVGTVTDAALAQQLYQTLLANAGMTRTGASETGQSLLIALQNGLVLQMSVREESLMACGTWECPEFFEAFAAAVQ